MRFKFKKHTLKKKVHQDSQPYVFDNSHLIILAVALLIGGFIYVLTAHTIHSLLGMAAALLLGELYTFTQRRLKESARVRKIEEVFPDFIELVASNLRAGMTIDKALLLSARKEFSPLDVEIDMLGKEILTGKDITAALYDLANRIKSDKISKTINIITTGIVSGGNLSILLEETAGNMRQRIFVEKRAASGVLMYVIFIVFAISIGTPILFGLSSILVEVLTNILSNIPAIETKASVPLTLTSIHISTTFIWYFSLIFIIMTDILASMILGLVSKGQEREGIKYIAPLIAVSVGTFIVIRFVLSNYFITFFS